MESVQQELLKKLTDKSSINEIQSYIKEVMQIRGFNKEKSSDKILLLVEEVGDVHCCDLDAVDVAAEVFCLDAFGVELESFGNFTDGGCVQFGDFGQYVDGQVCVAALDGVLDFVAQFGF